MRNKKQQLYTVRIGLAVPTDDLLIEVAASIAKLLRTDPVTVAHSIIVAAVDEAFAKKLTLAEELLAEEQAKRLADEARAAELREGEGGWVPWELQVGPYTNKRVTSLKHRRGVEHLINFVNWAVTKHLANAVLGKGALCSYCESGMC